MKESLMTASLIDRQFYRFAKPLTVVKYLHAVTMSVFRPARGARIETEHPSAKRSSLFLSPRTRGAD